MPFISKDWRSPGEAWVKTQEGWEKKKVLEFTKNTRRRDSSTSSTEADVIEEIETTVQPHCHITIKCTKEIAGFNGLDEVVKRLDFRNAVKDVRRFNYIVALLDLLIGQQTMAFSGPTQKFLLQMLEEVIAYAGGNQYNLRVLRKLLKKLRELSAAERGACWGGPLGSQMLWRSHSNTIDRILQFAAEIKIRKPAPGSFPLLQQLPEECLREIALRLSDHHDLVASAQACEELAAVCNEQRIWRELTQFYFTPEQIDLTLIREATLDWKKIYHALRRSYGLREDRQYAEMLSLCRHCKCLFWISIGHPCIADENPDYRARLQEAGGIQPPSPVPPAAFLKFFSL